MKFSRSISSVVALALLSVPGLAVARSTAAFSGFTPSPSDASCWVFSRNSLGAVRNACATTKNWIIPLVVDTTGYYSVTVYAYAGTTSANVGCTAVGVNSSSDGQWYSPTAYLPAFGSNQSIVLNGAYVPAGGKLFVSCDVGPNGFINGVSWSS